MDVAADDHEGGNPRLVWSNESRDFTPWLAKNLSILGEVIGMDLKLVATEVPVGGRVDLLARDLRAGSTVLVENQLSISDHAHLGQILTYLTHVKAETLVWIAPSFKTEHLYVVRWLNETTKAPFSFFAVKIAGRKVEGHIVPVFEILEGPQNRDLRVDQIAANPVHRRRKLKFPSKQVFGDFSPDHSYYRDLRNEQSRQIIDVENVFSAYKAINTELNSQFSGSMTWKKVNGTDYLYRKTQSVWRSLGPRSGSTQDAYLRFHDGRDRLSERLRSLKQRLEQMAPVNSALGLGRIPLITAKILRAVTAFGFENNLDVVGTTALFGYERLGAVRFDDDFLLSSHHRLEVAGGIEPKVWLGLLQKADRSFALASRGSFRAVNAAGFMVDLIKPMPKDRLRGIGDDPGREDDLQAIEIEGLAWLVNSPKHRVVVLDERGYPLEISVPDPRSFALHKAWLSTRDDREPIKRSRDDGQARLVARIVDERLPLLKFDGDDLSALPAAMRREADALVPPKVEEVGGLEPNW